MCFKLKTKVKKKANLSMCLTKHHIMETYGGVEVKVMLFAFLPQY
jgi:hypothetical protein